MRLLAFLAIALVVRGVHAEPAPFMMRATIGGRLVEGMPLAWSADQILLLGRDGALHDFAPAEAQGSKKTACQFAPYSTAEMQGALAAEFGPRFTISTSAHFVVAHPTGQGADWAQRLETLYRGFVNYTAVRGFRTTAPPAPLVAVVFPTQEAYYDHAAAGGTTLAEGTLGHYDGQSNRIFMYDARNDAIGNWSTAAETIVHEATHQTAYNVGVHARFAEQPRWAVEGLAMMFEAPGVWSAASQSTQADRINRYRLDYFREQPARDADWIPRLVTSDQPFDDATLDAYAEAWVLTFYLCETRPQAYAQYLARVAERKLFTKYTPAQRLADFTASFGKDLPLLAAHLQRFVETLP